MKQLLKEFKEFISKGNVLDLAVGVVIGGAFSSIVTSLVNDIIMPLVGIIIGGINFKGLVLKVADAEILYGSFIQNVINFLIIAACIFTSIKIINKFNRKKEEPKEVKPVKSADIILLEEIRDLLKENKKTTKSKTTKKSKSE